MRKAQRLDEIDAALNKFQPVTPKHDFFVELNDLRGDFKEKEVVQVLNVSTDENNRYIYNWQVNQFNKTLLFLAGMRGSGKTSELSKFAEILHRPECFFVVTCNIDLELDMDNVQYMDIIIFQLEKLLETTAKAGLKLDKNILESMEVWFQARVKEINRTLKAEGSTEMDVGNDSEFSLSDIANIPKLLSSLLGMTFKLRTGLSGSYERATIIRTSFKNRFIDFAKKFNIFIGQTNSQLRKQGLGREVLFIVDGLEKTMSASTRRKIIMEESNRIRQIEANTIFTLPIELMKEEQKIRNFSEIITFPFIKVTKRNGEPVVEAVKRFEELLYRRVDKDLFTDEHIVKKAIHYSGGSPRQLLRIIEQSKWQLEASADKIDAVALERAIHKLGNNMARYLEPEDWRMLKEIKAQLEGGYPIGFNSLIQGLLEKEILFEYNDGTYKRVNPLLELSKLYQYNIQQ